MVFVYARFADPVPGSKDFPAWPADLPRLVETRSESLYANAQIRHALNPFVFLIAIASDAKVRFSLNWLGAHAREWTH
jgi:hypothetical protein